jgi:hypothetical protein
MRTEFRTTGVRGVVQNGNTQSFIALGGATPTRRRLVGLEAAVDDACGYAINEQKRSGNACGCASNERKANSLMTHHCIFAKWP